jgi:nucleotide-binding universal stress UspA family protein
MVANQVKFKEAFAVRVELTKDDQGVYVKNSKAWQAKILECFAVFGIDGFLLKDSGIEVPKDQAVNSCLDRFVQKGLATVKKERIASATALVKVEEKGEEKDGKGSPSSKTKPIDLSVESFMETVMKSRAVAVKEERQKEIREQAGQGLVEAPVLFVDPLKVVRESVFLSARAAAASSGADLSEFDVFTVKFPFKGEAHVGVVEDIQNVPDRMLSWRLMLATVEKAIDENILKSISVGNTYKLWTVVRSELTNNCRGVVVEELKKAFEGLDFKKSELFGTFVKRIESLVAAMDNLEPKMVIDVDLFRNKIMDIMEGSNEIVRETWHKKSDCDAYRNHTLHPLEVLKTMMDTVQSREMSQKMSSERAKGKEKEKKREKELKKERERERRREEQQAAAAVMQESATTLRTQTRPGGAGPPDGRAKWLRSVCLFFQDGTCRREKCTFQHTKLSEADLGALKAEMDKRKSPHNSIICYTCNKPGHISPACPTKKVFAGSAVAQGAGGAQGAAPTGADAALKALEGLSAAEKMAFANLLCGAE